jgi:hypothetical protein
MKTPRSIMPIAFALVVAAVSMGYSIYTTAQVRSLEVRLYHAEALLQPHSQSVARDDMADRIRRLEERMQTAQIATSQGQLVTGSDSLGLEQRIQNVEQYIKPRLEVLPPYVPNR